MSIPDGWPSRKHQQQQRGPVGRAFPGCSVSVGPGARRGHQEGRGGKEGAWGGGTQRPGSRECQIWRAGTEQRPGLGLQHHSGAVLRGLDTMGVLSNAVVKCFPVLPRLLYFLHSPCPCQTAVGPLGGLLLRSRRQKKKLLHFKDPGPALIQEICNTADSRTLLLDSEPRGDAESEVG